MSAEVVVLEQYFSRPDTVDRIRGCWLGGPKERYVAWLSSQGYTARNLRSRVPRVKEGKMDRFPFRR